jgi:hypothetical protein
MSENENAVPHADALFNLISEKYSDRLDDKQKENLRELVTNVARNAEAMKSVKLENGAEPFTVFTPYRKEG